MVCALGRCLGAYQISVTVKVLRNCSPYSDVHSCHGWTFQVAPIAHYYQVDSIRQDTEEKIRTTILPLNSGAGSLTVNCVINFEMGFPGYVPDWTPRAGHEADRDIYKNIAMECTVRKVVGGTVKYVVHDDETWVTHLKTLSPVTLVGVMLQFELKHA